MGEFVERGERINGAGSRHWTGALLVRWRAVYDAAAEAGVEAADGGARLTSVRVPGADGEGAVSVVVVVAAVEIGCNVASAGMVAGTAGSEGGTPAAGVHCSVHYCLRGCEDVPVGDCWSFSCRRRTGMIMI